MVLRSSAIDESFFLAERACVKDDLSRASKRSSSYFSGRREKSLIMKSSSDLSLIVSRSFNLIYMSLGGKDKAD